MKKTNPKAIGTVKATLKLTGTANLKKPVKPPVRPAAPPAAPVAPATQPRRRAAAAPARARRVPQTPPPIVPLTPAPLVRPPNAVWQFCRRNWMSLVGLTMLALALLMLLLLLLKHNGGNGNVSMFTGTNMVPAGFNVTVSPVMTQTVNGENYGKRPTPAAAHQTSLPEGWLTDEEFNSSQLQAEVPATASITALQNGRQSVCESYTIPAHGKFTYPLVDGSKYVVTPWGNTKGVQLYYNRCPVEMFDSHKLDLTSTSDTFINNTNHPVTIGFKVSLWNQ